MKTDLGLLLLRLGAGGMMSLHGLGKAADLLAGRTEFSDPIGLGPLPTLLLAVFAEFVCAWLVILGLKTRWAAIPVVLTMLVAAFVVHAPDDFGTKEFPLLYAVTFATLIFTGAGEYSLDHWLEGRRDRSRYRRRLS